MNLDEFLIVIFPRKEKIINYRKISFFHRNTFKAVKKKIKRIN